MRPDDLSALEIEELRQLRAKVDAALAARGDDLVPISIERPAPVFNRHARHADGRLRWMRLSDAEGELGLGRDAIFRRAQRLGCLQRVGEKGVIYVEWAKILLDRA